MNFAFNNHTRTEVPCETRFYRRWHAVRFVTQSHTSARSAFATPRRIWPIWHAATNAEVRRVGAPRDRVDDGVGRVAMAHGSRSLTRRGPTVTRTSKVHRAPGHKRRALWTAGAARCSLRIPNANVRRPRPWRLSRFAARAAEVQRWRQGLTTGGVQRSSTLALRTRGPLTTGVNAAAKRSRLQRGRRRGS
jgi:hypothetical protein